MNRRPGITLLEVLVAIFVMGIGLLALLVLFPLAALTMAQAIRDDRSSQAAQQAANLALALKLTTDSVVQPTPGTPGSAILPCYIDGIGLTVYHLPTTLVSTPNIKRLYPNGIPAGSPPPTPPIVPTYWGANPSGSQTNQDAIRYFSLLDDLTFDQNGKAASPTGFVERSGSYTWAYFLSSTGTNPTTTQLLVDLKVVVYYKRTAQSSETPLTPSGVSIANTSTLTISYAGSPPSLRRGSWIFDAGSPTNATGYFYRVVDVTDLGGTMQFQLETPLLSNVYPTNTLLYLEDVIDVYDRGSY